MAILLAAVAAAAGVGCSGDTCGDASTECADARTLRTCAGSVDAIGQSRHLSTHPCPTANPFCVTEPRTAQMSSFEAANRSFCASAPEPSSTCARREPGTFCLDGAPFFCRGGFSTREQSCGAGTVCLASANVAGTCATCLDPDAGSDPRCGSGATTTCSNNAVVGCSCGFVGPSIQDCGTQACVVTDGGTSSDVFCAVSSQIDARCVGHDFDLFCARGSVVSCRGGFDVLFQPCDAGCNDATAACR